MEDQEKPFFLFLGDSDREGVTSKLKAAGVLYEKKKLESSVYNWESILSYFEDDELFSKPPVAGVLVKLTSIALRHMISPEYEPVARRLLERIKHVSHIVFVHESFFLEDSADVDEDGYSHFFGNVSDETRETVKTFLEEFDLKPIPYKTNAELSVLAMEFIDGSERNLILRLYVPAGRMWAGEMDKLLSLFRDYLNRVAGLHVRQEQFSTVQGVVYEFYGDERFDPSTLPQKFDDFSRLLDACAISPAAGQRMLASSGLDIKTVEEIVEKYAKEAKRLHVDLKHERERKVLGIRHRLEAELTDFIGSDADWDAINELVDQSVPRLTGVTSAIGFGGGSEKAHGQTAVTMNVGTQIIGGVNSIVAQEISGTRNIGLQANQLLELIREFGGAETAQLVSAVYELEDEDSKAESRLSARQRLKGFLYNMAGKVGDGAFSVLQAYVQSKLGL